MRNAERGKTCFIRLNSFFSVQYLSHVSLSKFQFNGEFKGHGFVSRRLLCVTLVKQSHFIYFIYLGSSKHKHCIFVFVSIS